MLQTRIVKQGSTVLRIDFEYTSTGEIDCRYSDEAGTTLVAKTTYAYDAQGQLQKIESKDGSDSVIDSFEYTWSSGQLASRIDIQPGIESGSPRTTNYAYDDQGQLTQDGSSSYSYDAGGNRDAYVYDVDYKNQVTDDGVWTYSYDGEGNVEDKYSSSLNLHWHYDYDQANQLVEAKKYAYSGGVDGSLQLDVKYAYDIYGGRIEKNVGGGIIRFALDGWNTSKGTPVGNENWDVLADFTATGSLATRYVRGDAVDQLFGSIASTGSPTWYLTDHLGSVRDVIAGGAVHSIDYDAFGKIVQDDSSRGHYGWTGRETDVETGLQYNRARYYDAATGRWVSQDPLGFDAGDSNLYRYVYANPISKLDASGLLSKDDLQNNPQLFGYYKNYGWVDWNHADPEPAESLLKQIREKHLNGSNAKTVSAVNFSTVLGGLADSARVKVPNAFAEHGYIQVNFQNPANRLLQAIAYPVVTYLIDVGQKGLSDEQLNQVALGIFRDYQEIFEWWQVMTIPKTGSLSGFSAEDLPSDLIGFYRAADTNLTRKKVEDTLGEKLTQKESIQLIEKLGGDLGLKQNKNPLWTPKNFHAQTVTFMAAQLNRPDFLDGINWARSTRLWVRAEPDVNSPRNSDHWYSNLVDKASAQLDALR